MDRKNFCLPIQAYVLLMCLLLWTCQRNDELEGNFPQSSEKLEISFNISSILSDLPGGRSPEVQDVVRNLTIFIFDNLTQQIEFAYYFDFNHPIPSNEVDISRWNSERIIGIAYSAILNDLGQKRDIHVLANSENLAGSIFTVSQLTEQLTTPITGKINYSEEGYYMHGGVEGHNFAEKFRAEVNLKRNVARIELVIHTLDKENMISFLPDNSIIAMQAINVADRAFLLEQEASSEDTRLIFYEKEELENKVKEDNKSLTTTAFYINENYLSKGVEFPERNATAVVIQVPYLNVVNGRVYESNYYKFYINKVVPYVVGRNTIYRVTLTIKDLGGETDLAAPVIEGDLEVISWSDEIYDVGLL
ncbi:MAG: hypothetical protein LIO65_02485 [Odoribacter sp.]|nr:hypothetical protein [Odoribacter sp.]